MDTQSKIVTPEAAHLLLESSGGSGQIAVVAALFDPFTLEVAQLLKRLAVNARLVAVVLDGPQTVLAATARAILVAALRTVHQVTIAPQHSWLSLLPANFAGSVHFDPDEDARRSKAFTDVILRHHADKSF